MSKLLPKFQLSTGEVFYICLHAISCHVFLKHGMMFASQDLCEWVNNNKKEAKAAEEAAAAGGEEVAGEEGGEKAVVLVEEWD